MASVCGLNRDLLERCRADFGFPHVTTDYRELLRQNLDGVVIASPHPLHAEHALAALRAGCHVMVEKPFTTGTADARKVVNLAAKRRRHVLIPYGWHYRAPSLKARELLDGGAIGKLEFAACHMATDLKNLFAGKSFDFEEGVYAPPELSTWADPRISRGGYGQGQLSHAVGLLMWLTGLRAKSVFATMTRPGARVDMYDALSVTFSSGAAGSISGAATLPSGTPGTFQLDIRLFGSGGALVLDLARDHLSIDTHSGRHRTFQFKAGAGAYLCDGPPNQFVDLIAGRTSRNDAPGTVGLRAVEILDAAYRSDRSGRRERV